MVKALVKPPKLAYSPRLSRAGQYICNYNTPSNLQSRQLISWPGTCKTEICMYLHIIVSDLPKLNLFTCQFSEAVTEHTFILCPIISTSGFGGTRILIRARFIATSLAMTQWSIYNHSDSFPSFIDSMFAQILLTLPFPNFWHLSPTPQQVY